MVNLLPIEAFSIVGISLRTDNSDFEKLTSDLQGLWSRFFSENIADKIPNKINADIYCVYTDYEGDWTKPYSALLGCRVANLDNIPVGLIRKSFDRGLYKQFIAQGNLLQGVVLDTWKHIWSEDANLPRTYIADFEVYSEKSRNFENAEVDIFIGVDSR